eukprot:CAMPEP_0196574748 /NCGR_PEP_ID=MMETSP1081-20130531/4395_1 /TAXON_ID=36882 /ORGANISM="Pyramimonas amylifera, Strain CCMP720" /LENGTH=156 /DNA_ID=CAMNT_0041892857 /DNA_START=338 /DNA_END=805 /DNA_ORIENTATION=+
MNHDHLLEWLYTIFVLLVNPHLGFVKNVFSKNLPHRNPDAVLSKATLDTNGRVVVHLLQVESAGQQERMQLGDVVPHSRMLAVQLPILLAENGVVAVRGGVQERELSGEREPRLALLAVGAGDVVEGGGVGDHFLLQQPPPGISGESCHHLREASN